ncbi:hypothetical protein GHT09_015398 [Marmota monax]|uniref:Uncharacterized protein n=1 Tax=Marmota monax TaxID=9995 RepID=A0A834QBM2_MARMO|nr:hypothetical protein GHT09_015398 [Marmota monax]
MRHLVIVLPRGRAWDPNFQFGGRPMVASSLERRVWLQPRETFALPDSLAPEQCSARGRLGSLRASGVPQAPRGAATLRPLQALDSLAAALLFPPPMARAPRARSPRARMANRRECRPNFLEDLVHVTWLPSEGACRIQEHYINTLGGDLDMEDSCFKKI